MGCACLQCDYARGNPDYKDGMVVSLALVDETEGKVRSHTDQTGGAAPADTGVGGQNDGYSIPGYLVLLWRRMVLKSQPYIPDPTRCQVFLIDATPNLRTQLWLIQHADRKGAKVK